MHRDNDEAPTLNRPDRITAHDNNFGALRLLLATLVIVGHSPPLALGWNTEDLSARITAAIAPHELAVNGFFLLSGYLITASVLRSRTWPYLQKRIGRIYPGFAVAYIISLLLALTAGGAFARPWPYELVHHSLTIARLGQPDLPGAYAGNPYVAVNGSLWTLSYEFVCYLMVLVLHRAKLLERRQIILAGTILLLLLGTVSAVSSIWWVHKLLNPLRLSALFLTGGLFYLYRGHIRYVDWWALAGASVLAIALFSQWTRLIAVAIGGGYALFWCGFRLGPRWIRQIGQRTDISFGVYLYAWPIQNLFVWHYPDINPWILCIATIPLAGLAGYLSWTLVERHFVGGRNR